MSSSVAWKWTNTWAVLTSNNEAKQMPCAVSQMEFVHALKCATFLQVWCEDKVDSCMMNIHCRNWSCHSNLPRMANKETRSRTISCISNTSSIYFDRIYGMMNILMPYIQNIFPAGLTSMTKLSHFLTPFYWSKISTLLGTKEKGWGIVVTPESTLCH